MSEHYLSKLFAPNSVAVFGASDDPQSMGAVVYANLVGGGFAGAVHPINIRPHTLNGRPVHASLDEVDGPVDLAVIATPAETVPGIVEACGRRGVKAVSILSAGFAEAYGRGAFLERSIIETARRYQLRVLGAKCLGVVRPRIDLNVSVAEGHPRPGDLALVSQSGAICASVLDWAHSNDIGFSTIVSVGTAMDIDFGEILDFLVSDHQTRSILLHVERVRDARRFMSALRAAARVKPVVAVKAGRYAELFGNGQASAGPIGFDDVFDAALTRAGVARVSTIGDLFSAARVLAGSKRPAGKRLAIVCNGGGPGVLAADRAADLGLSIAELAPETIAELDTTQRQAWSRSNPVDILGDVNNERYAHALKACLDDPNVDGVIAMLCPQSIVEPLKMAKGMAEMARDSMKPVLACWLGEVHVWESRKLFNEAQIPSFRAPEAAADAFAFLAKHHQNRSNLLQTPGALSEEGAPDVEGARIIIETALSERRKALTELESKALLSAFRIPVNPYMVAHSASEALLFAEQLGFPVAMKALSPSIEHKTESHAMMLNLASAPAVRTAYADIIAAVKARHPQAAIEGISVERMVSRPNGRELSVGVVTDPVFGPVITFGQDSMHADAVRQRAVALPPLNRMLIANLLLDSRVTRLLRGTRSKPPVNIAALADLLQRVSEMVCELPWLKQMEIDPCVVNEQGAVVLSARMLVDHHFAGQDRYRHMAICPYPIHLASRWQLADGTNLLIRPIRPEDADLEQEFVRSLSDQTRYLRFQLGLTELTPAMLARFTQIDYDREMALVVETTCNGRTVLIGEARYNINPDGESCEFGLVVSDQWRNRGLGAKLMQCLMDAAREKGLKSIHGDVLRVNEGMHSLMTNLGFWEEQINDDDDGIVFSKTL